VDGAKACLSLAAAYAGGVGGSADPAKGASLKASTCKIVSEMLADDEELTKECKTERHAAPRPAAREAPPPAPIPAASGMLRITPAIDDTLCVSAKNLRGGVGSPLHLWHCNNRPNQVWALTPQPGGAQQVVGIGGLCLGGAATGGSLQLTPCNDAATRRVFRLVTRPNGQQLHEVQSNMCLSAHEYKNHGAVLLETCDPTGQGQSWKIEN
jgi:hypothetical protein